MSDEFGKLLRAFRTRIPVSQEELAERARVSPGAISALERGTRRAPYRATVALLADALSLAGKERQDFEQAAQRARVRSRRDTAHPLAGALPVHLTTFFGDPHTIEALRRLVASQRLVTITGSGGVGKTRTAIEVVADWELAKGDVRFVDLSRLRDGAFLASALGSALDAPLSEQNVPLHRLATSLKARSFILVLDNCEHLLANVAEAVRALLEECPSARIVATSRERLNISSETVYRLPSLHISDADDLAAARECAAVRLFVDRAKLSDPRFTVADARVPTIVDICRRLDGIPLAIEIAARRLPTLGLKALRERIDEHFSLEKNTRDMPARQETMRATVRWSCNLLDTPQRTLLRRLAVFSGSFSIEAAAQICRDRDEQTNDPNIAAILLELVDKSLVEPIQETDDAFRYVLLDSVRTEQISALREAAEEDRMQRRLGQWLVTFHDRLRAKDNDWRRNHWLSTVWPEFDNVRAALEFALRSPVEGDGKLAARIVGDFRSMWIQTGRRDELATWAAEAVDRVDETREPLVVARVLWALMFATRGSKTFEVGARTITLFDRCGDRAAAAAVRGQLGYEFLRRGKFQEAEDALSAAAASLRESGQSETALYAGVLRISAWTHGVRGMIDLAFAEAREAMFVARRLDDELTLLQVTLCLAEIEFTAGNVDRAIELSEDVLDRSLIRREAARDSIEALCNLGSFRMALCKHDAAEAAARGALARAGGRYPMLTHWAIQHLAALAAIQGDVRRAGRLLGFVDRWVMHEGFVRHPVEQHTYEIARTALNASEQKEALETFRAQGERLTFESASEEALSR